MRLNFGRLRALARIRAPVAGIDPPMAGAYPRDGSGPRLHGRAAPAIAPTTSPAGTDARSTQGALEDLGEAL